MKKFIFVWTLLLIILVHDAYYIGKRVADKWYAEHPYHGPIEQLGGINKTLEDGLERCQLFRGVDNSFYQSDITGGVTVICMEMHYK